MKIAIICASDDELAPFLQKIEYSFTETVAMLRIYRGAVNGHTVYALYSGVGKVNAAIAAQIVIDRYGPDCIINAGTAGAIDGSLRVFDTVVSTETAYHDMAEDILTEFHPFMPSVWFKSDERLLQAAKEIKSQFPMYFGRTVTGESFITDSGRKEITDVFAPLSVDMEAAAIAHVCYANGVPFLSVRTVTDTPEKTGNAEFEKNCKSASETARRITFAIIEKL